MILTVLSSCSPDKAPVHEVIVIGGGLMGSSAGWHLSGNNNPILLLEMQDSVYTYGSSYGEARIARSNNRGNDIWSYLHNRSVKETQDLVEYLNSTEEGAPYAMDMVYTTSPVTYVGRTRIYERLLASLERQKVTYDMASTPQEGKANYDVNLPDSVLIQREYNQHSGTMNPKALIQLLHRGITKKGGEIRYQTKVTKLQYNEKNQWYEIETKNIKNGKTEVLRSKKIVSAAGPYTGQLLKDIAPYFEDLISPERVFLAFYKIKESAYANLSGDDRAKLRDFYPVINSSKGTRSGSFFSMIEYYDEKDQPIIKIGGHFQRSSIENLDEVWKRELSQEEIDWSLNSTADYMQLLNLPIRKEDFELVNGYSCVYSLTSSEVPLVTPILTKERTPNNNFIVMGGMSGVGAKGAMTYGLIAAEQISGNMAEKDSLYQVTAEAIGFGRLKEVEF